MARAPDEDRGLFLILWIVLVIVFFSLSGSKLPLYILPAYPAAALLIGPYLASAEERWNGSKPLPRIHWYGIGTCLVLGFLGVIALLLRADKLPMPVRPYAAAMIIGMSVLLCLALRFRKGARTGPTAVLFLSSALLVLCVNLGFQEGAAHQKSGYGLAGRINALAGSNDPVVDIFTYQRNVSFYCHRRQVLVDYEKELRFGLGYSEDRERWNWTSEQFLDEWRSGRRLWAIIQESRLDWQVASTGQSVREELRGYYEVGRDGMWTLITNRPPVYSEHSVWR